MKKNAFAGKIIALALTCSTLGSLVACGGTGTESSSGGGGKPIPNATQLKVRNYDGGVGNEWLYALEAKYEALMANVELEPGKKGVDISVDPQKTSVEQDILSDAHVVVSENIEIYSIISKGAAVAIDDVVTADNVWENGKTIESRLTEDQKSALKAMDGHYYFIPHYQTFGGVFYNVDMFEQNAFYLKQGGGWTRNPSEMTAGPDGDISTTFDNGLPATYEEFKSLMNRMVASGVNPLTFAGAHKSYSNFFLNALYRANAGIQTKYNYTFNSGSDTVKLHNGTSVTITVDNAYELWQSQARYEALEFFSEVIGNKDATTAYLAPDASNQSIDMMAAQDNFVLGNPQWEREKVAMLAEGSYWVNEAKDTIEEEEDFTGNELKFAYMPMPTVKSGTVTKNINSYVLDDQSGAYMFINKKGVGENQVIIDLAKDFLQFANTETALQEFTTITNCTKGLSYGLTDAAYNSLSYFGKNIWDAKKRAEDNDCLLYYGSESPIYRQICNKVSLNHSREFWGQKDNLAFTQMYENKMSVNDYFNSIKMSQTTWNGYLGN